ncbi:hypothetical protein AACH06_18785 [Ideonella sp. DXS29W]|uniref:DUF6985 domain-containing protein n=1 Tax=Ideonella lacteola TaxID=2984193 RepID=A0ABU9BSN7_9BURK
MQELVKEVTTEGNWPLQGQVFLSLFDRYIPFAVEDEASIEYVIQCAEYMNSWSEETIESLCQACIRYCNDFREMIGEDTIEFSSPREVLELVHPTSLIVPNPDFPEPVAHLELNCDWEEEHGMEWIVRGAKVLYVGGFNGQSPWESFVPKKSWNYA